MGIIDRVILSVYTLLLTVFSVGIIAISLGVVPLDMILYYLHILYGHWEGALIGSVFLLVSLRLLMAGVRSRTSQEAIIHHGNVGDIHISLEAIKNMVEKTARNTKGIRWTKVRIYNSQEGLMVRMHMVVSPESNVPEVSDEMQRRIQERIRQTVGVEVVKVEVLVDDISNDFKNKQRVQ